VQWHAARLRRHRRLLLAGCRARLLHDQINQDNNVSRRKRTPEEKDILKRVADEQLDQLYGIRLDNLWAKAVCQNADDLQKLDALIDRVDRWCAVMRAECDPLFGRAVAAGRIKFVQGDGQAEEALTEPDETAPMLLKVERQCEQGEQPTHKLPN
jgi:hypothetical protein